MTDPRYPIGQYQAQPFSESTKQAWLTDIRFLPQLLERSIENLDQSQLHTPYRDGGWTLHQVVHHVADSHMNAYCRFKLGLTEDLPTIKPYEEQLWAELDDVKGLPCNISITLLYALHARLFELLKDLPHEQWDRKVFHPASQKEMSLWYLLGSYAWHGKHHVAHITSLREKNGW